MNSVAFPGEGDGKKLAEIAKKTPKVRGAPPDDWGVTVVENYRAFPPSLGKAKGGESPVRGVSQRVRPLSEISEETYTGRERRRQGGLR